MSDTRKQTAFRLQAGLLARMDGAVRAGVAKNRTALVEWAVEKALSDGAVSDAVRSVALPADGQAASSRPSTGVGQGDGAHGQSAMSRPPAERPAKRERLERARASADVRPASWMLERQRKLNEGR